MKFWKRLSLIATAVLVVLWLVLVAAAGFGAAPPSAPPTRPCITNCL